MQTQTKKQQPAAFSLGRSCTKCGHIQVCSLYRAISPLLEGWTDQTRPFDACDLAAICKHFLSVSVLEILNGAE